MIFLAEDWNKSYVESVNRATEDYESFLKFKQDPDYRTVLEHVTPEIGKLYLDEIKKDNPKLVQYYDYFKINDKLGSPDLCDYAEIGKTSPSTIRYVKVASDIKIHFGKDIGSNIVEIGCGYGGQCLIMDCIFTHKSYTLFDLYPVNKLIEKYLESFILKTSYSTNTINKYDGSKEFDLVISNYAFSELPKLLQTRYIEKVLLKSKRGYLTMNSSKTMTNDNHMTLSELKEYMPFIEVHDEVPLTSYNNYIITWNLTKQ